MPPATRWRAGARCDGERRLARHPSAPSAATFPGFAAGARGSAEKSERKVTEHPLAGGRSLGPKFAGSARTAAGHALALGAVFVTHNTREFSRVPGLTVEDRQH